MLTSHLNFQNDYMITFCSGLKTDLARVLIAASYHTYNDVTHHVSSIWCILHEPIHGSHATINLMQTII